MFGRGIIPAVDRWIRRVEVGCVNVLAAAAAAAVKQRTTGGWRGRSPLTTPDASIGLHVKCFTSVALRDERSALTPPSAQTLILRS